MADETIAPALTAEEWADGEFDSHYCRAKTSLEIDYKGRVFATSEMDGEDCVVILNEAVDAPTVLPKIIALANHALPDSHPLKIESWNDIDQVDYFVRSMLSMAKEHIELRPRTPQWMLDEEIAATEKSAEPVRRLLAKLAALLPPEGA